MQLPIIQNFEPFIHIDNLYGGVCGNFSELILMVDLCVGIDLPDNVEQQPRYQSKTH